MIGERLQVGWYYTNIIMWYTICNETTIAVLLEITSVYRLSFHVGRERIAIHVCKTCVEDRGKM